MKVKKSLRHKAVLAILLLAFVLTATAVLISYNVYARTMDAHYEEVTMNVAQTAASVLDAEELAKQTKGVYEIYSKNPSPEFLDEKAEQAYLAQYDYLKDDGYKKIQETLAQIKNANDVRALYIAYMDPITMTGIYIVDADPPETAASTGVWERIFENNYEAMAEPAKGFPAYISDTEEFGWLCSAGAAVLDEIGGVLAHVFVDISMDSVMQDRYRYLIHLCFILMAVTTGLILLFIYVVNHAVVNPVNSLSIAAASYVSDKTQRDHSEMSSIEKLQITTGDEIENLSTALKQMEREIGGYIENLTAVTAEKERIGAELNVANHIQASMLPCIFPAFPERTELDIYASMIPAKEVGGDFYDFFLIDDDRLAVVMADVSGKGVPAALFMVITKILLKNVAQTGLSPKSVLEKVNSQLCVGNDEEMFVTVWLGILEISSGKMLCANAGHEYPSIKRANGNYELIKDKHGFVLAGMEGSRYQEYELEMNPGDKLFLYTDGVAEATDVHNELYGTDRMIEALNRSKDESCEMLLRNIKQDIDRFVGEAPQFDDITMLSLELRPRNVSGMRKLKVVPTLEATEEITAFVEGILEESEVPMKVVMKMNIVVDEIFSNIVRYSNASDATVSVSVENGQIILRFADNGLPYDPTQKEDPNITLIAEEREIGGLGLFMVKKSVDKIEYQYRDELNILTLTKSISETTNGL